MRSTRRRPTLSLPLAFAVLAVAAAALVPRPASAQCFVDCGDDSPPTVEIEPAGQTFTSTNTVDVTVSFCDDGFLTEGDRTITFNGSDVTSSFSWESGASCTGSTENKSVGTVTLQDGSNTLTAEICDSADQCTSESVSYTYDSGPDVDDTHVDLSFHNGEYRNAALCAVGCFDATASYTIPAYRSLDASRSLTLLYRSSQADLRGRVTVDVDPSSLSETPDEFSLRLKAPDGSWVTFTDGSEEIFWQGSSQPRRLAVQFDADGLETGAHEYTVVTRFWFGSTVEEVTKPATVLVVNERSSPFGAGWSVPGLQRLDFQAGGDIVVLEGDGSALLFRQETSSSWAGPDGDFTELIENGSGQYERRYPNGTVVTFDGSGRMIRREDRFGNATTYGYGADGLTSVTDPAGKTIQLAYGSDGRLAWIEGPGGRRSTVTVDASGDLTSITDPTGTTAFQASYDGQHRLQTRTDRGGNTYDVAYDFAGELESITAPQIQVEGGTAQPQTAFDSHASRLLVDPGTSEGTSSNPATAQAPGAARASVTDPGGRTTRYAVDRWGAARRVETPGGDVTRVVRDAQARVTKTVAPDGGEVTMEWQGPDMVRKCIGQFCSGGTEILVDYESTYHQPIRVYGDVVDRWLYYGAEGRLDSVKVGSTDAAPTIFEHDGRGRVTSTTDPEGHTRGFTYQSGGYENVASVTGTGQKTTSFLYDGFGRRIATITPEGDTARTAFDALNRVEWSATVDADTTRFTHGALALVEVEDPKGQAYSVQRNALGWVTQRTDPRGNTSTVVYNAAGQVEKRTDRAGRTVDLEYDAQGRLASRTAGGQTATYTTNLQQGFVAASNPVSTDTIKFDDQGRRDSLITVRGGTTYRIDLGHAPDGRLTRIALESPVEREVRYSHGDGLLTGLTYIRGLSGDTSFVTRDGDGQVTRIGLPTGDTLDREVTPTHRSARLEWTDGSLDQAFGLSFSLDSLGRITRRIRRSSDTTRRYAYDAEGRLTGYTDEVFDDVTVDCTDGSGGTITGADCDTSGGVTTVGGADYSYDAVGNRTDSGASLATGNRLTSFDGWALDWNAAGELVHKQKSGFDQRLYWGAGGRLDSVETNGQTTRFFYDAFGRRVRKEGPDGTTGLLWAAGQVFVELDGSGSVEATYSYYPGVDRPHAMRRNGSLYYYARSPRHAVQGLFDTSGNPVNRYRYGPWGETASASEGVENPYRFGGRRYDAATGLYYNRARYYDPDLGRFVSQDPLGLQAGINPYAYAGNDPINAIDPSGLCHLTWSANHPNPGHPHVCPIRVTVSNLLYDHNAVRSTGPTLGCLSRGVGAADVATGGQIDLMGRTGSGGGSGGAGSNPLDEVGRSLETSCGSAVGDLALSIAADAAFVASGGLSKVLQGAAALGRAGAVGIRAASTAARTGVVGLRTSAKFGAGVALGSPFAHGGANAVKAGVSNRTFQTLTVSQAGRSFRTGEGLVRTGLELVPGVGTGLNADEVADVCF